MRILLPPSETKRPGGTSRALDLDALPYPLLRQHREQAIAALVALSASPTAATKVLSLSARQLDEIETNRVLRSGKTMPAIDRYTGVLYDAVEASSLDARARRWLGEHVLIHTAPFGPVGALDRIPAYRLAAGTSLPGVPPLRRHWSAATSEVLAVESCLLDLRSEAYVALGPIPETVACAYVRVVTDSGRALNHFNKKAKGALVRILALERPRVRTISGLLRWAHGADVPLRPTADLRILELISQR